MTELNKLNLHNTILSKRLDNINKQFINIGIKQDTQSKIEFLQQKLIESDKEYITLMKDNSRLVKELIDAKLEIAMVKETNIRLTQSNLKLKKLKT